MTTSSGDGMSTTFDYSFQLLAETREEVGRADTKASILLGFAGVIATVFGGLAFSGHGPYKVFRWIEIIELLGATLYIVGIMFLAGAVMPRSIRKRNQTPYFFGDIAAYPDEKALLAGLAQASLMPTDRVVNQLFVVSKIVVRKYEDVRRGMIMLGLGLLVSGVGSFPAWRLK